MNVSCVPYKNTSKPSLSDIFLMILAGQCGYPGNLAKTKSPFLYLLLFNSRVLSKLFLLFFDSSLAFLLSFVSFDLVYIGLSLSELISTIIVGSFPFFLDFLERMVFFLFFSLISLCLSIFFLDLVETMLSKWLENLRNISLARKNLFLVF